MRGAPCASFRAPCAQIAEATAPSPPPWPEEWVPAAEFEVYVAARREAGGPRMEEPTRKTSTSHAPAFEGRGDALLAFRARVRGRDAARPSRRLSLSADDVAELTQVLRHELLVPSPAGAPPALASYAGRGPLSAWVRVTATRKGLKACRRDRSREAGEDSLLEVEAPGDDVELAYLRSLYGEPFRAAFLAAMGALESQEKNVLRQHFIDGLTIDQLAALHGMHRATTARWIARARRHLLSATRREFAKSLQVSPIECDSVLRLLSSRLDVTWRRLLA